VPVWSRCVSLNLTRHRAPKADNDFGYAKPAWRDVETVLKAQKDGHGEATDEMDMTGGQSRPEGCWRQVWAINQSRLMWRSTM
jgi:hypothetical protein